MIAFIIKANDKIFSHGIIIMEVAINIVYTEILSVIIIFNKLIHGLSGQTDYTKYL